MVTPAALAAESEFVNNLFMDKDWNVVHMAELTSSKTEALSESSYEYEGAVFCSLERATEDSMNSVKDLLNSKAISSVASMLTQEANVLDSNSTPRVAEVPLDITPVPDFQVEAAPSSQDLCQFQAARVRATMCQPSPAPVPAPRVRVADIQSVSAPSQLP